MGLLLRSALLVSTALTSILLLHALWLLDAALGLATGTFPLRATGYLADAPVWIWLATAHHFYLGPLLLLLVLRARSYTMAALPAAMLLFAVLTLVSRWALPAVSNVNHAFTLLPTWRHPLGHSISRLPAAAYLVALNAVAAGLFFLPAAVLLRRSAGVPEPVACDR
jgi:hypothetical protein